MLLDFALHNSRRLAAMCNYMQHCIQTEQYIRFRNRSGRVRQNPETSWPKAATTRVGRIVLTPPGVGRGGGLRTIRPTDFLTSVCNATTLPGLVRAPRRGSELGLLYVLALLLIALSGCSIRRYALNQVSDALAQSGSSFSGDDDPELIKAAAPFSLKLIESLLAGNPKHVGLLTAAASGFTQYAYAFVQEEADEAETRDLATADALRARARKLYLRARGYGLRGLEAKHPGFERDLLANPRAAVQKATKADVPLLYWTAAAWGSLISLSKDNPALVGQIPAMEALIHRALELGESYDGGAIHNFMISYEMGKPGASGDPAARAREHFAKAVALSHGKDASPYVTLAEAVTIQKQDVKEFESLLNQALAIDPDSAPANRLVNTIMQKRARWLLSRKAELFLIEEK
jgi:predicted anti-sigma-YlaC factor YlaD